MNIRDTLANAGGGLRNHYDDGVTALLDRLGLQQKRGVADAIVPTLAIFGSGFVLGALLGVAFAPKRGEDLRHDVRDRLGDIRERSLERVQQLRRRGADGAEQERLQAQLEHSPEERGAA